MSKIKKRIFQATEVKILLKPRIYLQVSCFFVVKGFPYTHRLLEYQQQPVIELSISDI